MVIERQLKMRAQTLYSSLTAQDYQMLVKVPQEEDLMMMQAIKTTMINEIENLIGLVRIRGGSTASKRQTLEN